MFLLVIISAWLIVTITKVWVTEVWWMLPISLYAGSPYPLGTVGTCTHMAENARNCRNKFNNVCNSQLQLNCRPFQMSIWAELFPSWQFKLLITYKIRIWQCLGLTETLKWTLNSTGCRHLYRLNCCSCDILYPPPPIVQMSVFVSCMKLFLCIGLCAWMYWSKSLHM